MVEIRNTSGSVIYMSSKESIRAALSEAILGDADLRSANLHYADLSYADLRSANLSYADLSYADLRSADLRSADLRYADLRSADLRYADLRSANLSYADLSSANLHYANLRSANLRSANLSYADLSYADLPSPTTILLASWGTLSDDLTADLMEYDASCHPDPSKFHLWASDGPCPYSDVKVSRAANFEENKHLWGKGKLCRPYDLMARVLREKCKWDG